IINGALLEGQRADLIFLKNVLFFSGGKLFFPLLLFSLGALGIFLSWGIAVIIAFSISLVLIAFLYREKAPRPVISLGILRPIASYSFLNYLTNLFNLLPSLVLPMVVLVRADANMAAYAYVAWMIATITFMVPNSVALSLFASCSNNPGSIKEKAKHSLYLSSALVVPMVIGIYLFGDLVLQFMGANFSIAAVTLSWLSLSALPIMGIATMVAVKRVKKHMVEVMVAYAITFSISLSFWYVLLPKWGMISIGVVWFLANSLAFLFLLFSLKYRGDLR
ncbi:MAG: oligosaccharide flippase family protein, partial [Thermoplasmata archaeon]|nr:oligosaccharide flippase family protein [Thermoplasmata archaeon]